MRGPEQQHPGSKLPEEQAEKGPVPGVGERLKKMARVTAIAGSAILAATVPTKSQEQIVPGKDLPGRMLDLYDKAQDLMSYKVELQNAEKADWSGLWVPALDTSNVPERLRVPVQNFLNSLQHLESVRPLLNMKSAKELLEMPQAEAEQYAEEKWNELRAHFRAMESAARALEDALGFGRQIDPLQRAVFEFRLKVDTSLTGLTSYTQKDVRRAFEAVKRYQDTPGKYAVKGTPKGDAGFEAIIAPSVLDGAHRWLREFPKKAQPALNEIEKNFGLLKNF